MKNIFGTDGIRGKANVYPMTPETIVKLGTIVGHLLKKESGISNVIIGKDTRLSGYMFEPALSAGFISAGVNVTTVGPMPTPAIAYLTQSMRCDIGVMISASHNPFEDNGIKIFGRYGFKLTEQLEQQIDKLLGTDITHMLVPSDELGSARRVEDAIGRYTEVLKQSVSPVGANQTFTLNGLRIVLDCSNGAAYKVAPRVLWELEAEVISIGISPNGRNINEGCGSTHTEIFKQTVLDTRADLGIALDGDADRIIMCDHLGNELDGDMLLAIIAKHYHDTGQLKHDTVVGTLMTNLGMEKWLNSQGMKMVRTEVGDKYIVREMVEKGYNLGGEHSGHIVIGDLSTTGDGLLAALQVLMAMYKNQKSLYELSQLYTPYPFKTLNLPLKGKKKTDIPWKEVEKEAEKIRQKISSDARYIIRPSGTEPLVRATVEAETDELVNDSIKALEKLLRKYV